MNPRERFLAALSGQEVDRTPTAHISSMVTVAAQEMTGCFMPRVHHDPEQLARLCAANHDVFGFDAVSFIINYFGEPAALGCEMNWGNERQLPMYISHPWQGVEEPVMPENLPDREPIRTYLDTIRIARKLYKNRMGVLGKIMGPFSLTQVMYGVENVMMGMIEEPEKIKHFINVAADILIKCGNAQFEEGIDALAIGEGGAGGNMLSPQMHEEFLLDAHKRMVTEIGGPTIMHICGDISPRLELLAKTGLTCFNFDWNIRPGAMKDASRGKFLIMGNVNTTDLLKAEPQVIEAQVTECLAAEVDIISPGCAISPECPAGNLKSIPDTVRQWHLAHR